jgi:hypothetical protein
MSSYESFLNEKNKLDGYMSQHFKIHEFKEDLSGAWLELGLPGGEKATLQLLTADGRKYASYLLIKQQTNS